MNLQEPTDDDSAPLSVRIEQFKTDIAAAFDAPPSCVPHISGGLLVNKAGAIEFVSSPKLNES